MACVNSWPLRDCDEQIQAAFDAFIQNGFDFQYTKEVTPTFTKEPYFDEQSSLVLEGNYANDDFQTDFTFQYFDEEGEYKLVGIDMYFNEITPDQTPGKEPAVL